MAQSALEVVESLDVWPFPLTVPMISSRGKFFKVLQRGHSLQDTSSIDEHMSFINEFRPSQEVFDSDMPHAIIFVPVSSNDLMIELHVLLKVERVHDVLEILPYLFGV